MECKWLHLGQVTSSWLIAKKQRSSQSYTQKRNRTELLGANDSATPMVSGLGNCPGAGYGSASLAECIDRLGGVSSLAGPAACLTT